MKWILPITIAILAVLANGDVAAQGNPTPPCRARTLVLRAPGVYFIQVSANSYYTILNYSVN